MRAVASFFIIQIVRNNVLSCFQLAGDDFRIITVADSDSDADGTADCNDACPADASKVSAGSCGCGVPESDSNGNGAPDCLDPTSSTIPLKPSSRVKGRRVTVTIPTQFSGVQYQIDIRKNGRSVALSTTASNSRRFTLSTGSYSVRYKVILGATSSKNSPAAKFKVR